MLDVIKKESASAGFQEELGPKTKLEAKLKEAQAQNIL